MAKKNLVGLDIGRYYTKIVELDSKKGVPVVKKAVRERTPDLISSQEEIDIDVMSEFLNSLFSQYKIKNRNVAFALNSSYVITKTVSMPLVVDEEIEQAVMWEAEQYAPFGMEQVNVSYQIMEKDKEKNEMTVLIVLTKKDIVESFVSALKKAKIHIKILDVDVFALSNAFFKNESDMKSKHNMLVDVGHHSTKIVFLKNEVPTFSRYVEFGFGSLIEDAAKTFGASESEISLILETSKDEAKKESLIAFINDKIARLYSQLQNSISFYENNVLNAYEDIDNIVFSGVFGVLFDYLKPGIPAELSSKNIVRFNPFGAFSFEGSVSDDLSGSLSSFYGVAVGLAVREL